MSPSDNHLAKTKNICTPYLNNCGIYGNMKVLRHNTKFLADNFQDNAKSFL